MKFEDAHRTLAKWLNEEIEAPIDRQALAVVLAGMTPPPLVRLTDDELKVLLRPYYESEYCFKTGWPDEKMTADLVMDAMQAKNGGAA